MARPMFLRRHRWAVVTAAVLLLGYVAVLFSMPRHVFWSPDEGGKFLQLYSIGWHGGFTYTIPYGAQSIDPNFQFYPQRLTRSGNTFIYPDTGADGTVRFHWPIWFPLLSSFMWRVFGLTGIYLIPLLSGWLIAVVSGLIMQVFNPRLAALTILLVGFATPVCFYSQCFWEHTLASLFGMVAVAIVVSARPGSRTALVAMVAPLLAAMLLRLEMIAFVAAIFLVWGLVGRVARTWPAAAAASPSADRELGWKSYLLVVVLAVGTISLAADMAPVRQQRLLTTLPVRLGDTFQKLPHLPDTMVSVLVNSERGEGPVLSPAWSTVACIAIGLCLVAPFLTGVWAEGTVVIPALAVMLAFSASVAFLDQEYRVLHGLVSVAPFVIIWLYALPDAWRRHDARLLALVGLVFSYLLLGVAAIFVFYVNAKGELTSGLEWGQRYLLTLYPMLAILSVVALESYRKSRRPVLLRSAVLVLVSAMMVIGVLQQRRGIGVLRTDREKFAVWESALSGDGPTVTNLWWLPATLAPMFVSKEMSYVRNRMEMAHFVRVAVKQGISGFTVASLVPVEDTLFASPEVQQLPHDGAFVSGLYLTRFNLAGVASALHDDSVVSSAPRAPGAAPLASECRPSGAVFRSTINGFSPERATLLSPGCSPG